MKKTKLNFIIDVFMFVCMSAVAGIGFLLKFTLVNGQQRWEKYGHNVNLSLFGIDRHLWGRIHLILGVLLLVFLVLHIIFHWKLIKCIYQKLISGALSRKIAASAFLIICLFLLTFPFILQPEQGEEEHEIGYIENHDNHNRGKMEYRQSENSEDLHHDSHATELPFDIKGYMSLNDISDQYHISVIDLKQKLNIPQNISGSQRLGQLMKIYHFTMSDVSTIIHDSQSTK